MGTTGFLQGFLHMYGQLQHQEQQRAQQQSQLEERRELHKLQGALLKGQEAKLQLEIREQATEQAHAQELSQALMGEDQARQKALLLRQQALYGKGNLLAALQGGRGQFGKEVTYGRNADKKLVAMVLDAEKGRLVEATPPEGTELVGPGYLNQIRTVPTGTGTAVLTNRETGQPRIATEIPKNIVDATLQETGATEAAKQAAAAPLEARKARATLDALTLQRENITRPGGTIDKLLALAPAGAGTFKQLNLTPLRLLLNNQQRQDLIAELRTLKANTGLDKLQDLRTAGTGLGSVTEGEHALLANLLASLDENMSPARLIQSLNELKVILHKQHLLREKAYRADFVGVDVGRPRGTPPRAAARPGTSRETLPASRPVRVPTPEELSGMSDEELLRLRQELGGR